MGKVKSSIITSILVIAVVVLTFFATVSFNLIGSNGVKRYNSFLSSIHLGSDLTGEAYSLLYPEGVISSARYNLVVNDSDSSEKDEYQKTYDKHGGVYVNKDKMGEELKASVRADAEIIRDRLGEKGYSSFTVSIEDDYVIKISLPTDYTYSAYRNKNTESRSESLQIVSHAVQYLTLDGDMSLRDGTSGAPVLKSTEDFASYFKKIDKYQMGGNHAVRMVLTDEGFEKINKIITAQESGNAVVYVGDTSLGLQFTYGTALTDKTLMYQAEQSYASDFAILMSSVKSGNQISNNYYDADGVKEPGIVSVTSVFGEYAAIYLAITLLLVTVGAIVYSIVKYKKLGLVCALMVLSYALTIIITALLLGIQITIAGALTALIGLALLVFSNSIVFEAIRKETALGRTIQAAVKVGYKKSLFTILDLHIVMLIVAIVTGIIGAGEVAACGLILFIATVASYVLYWFTRFMWYVLSSPVRDKFKFCGFAREDLDDED